MKQTSSARRRKVAAGMIALSLPSALSVGMLTGCGDASPRTAAVVGDRVITESDIDTVMKETAVDGSATSQKDRVQILTGLMLAPFVTSYLKSSGNAISADEAMRAVYPKTVGASEPTQEVALFRYGVNGLDQAGQEAVIADFAKSKVTVNPRYGQLDLAKGWGDAPQNWIVGATSSASAPAPSSSNNG